MTFRTLVITFLRTGVPFGIAMALVFSWLLGRSWGVIIGVASGVFFGSGMTLFVFLMFGRTRIRGDFENESVLWQGPASHIVPQAAKARAVWMAGTPTQAREGWLVLTPTRLAFRTRSRILRIKRLILPGKKFARPNLAANRPLPEHITDHPDLGNSRDIRSKRS
jgi:hypothetical protein